ncbi:MAG TPA: hypothetical protein VFY39_04265, partial [Gammaproteobacteria bacterium]|nr:hypothetical protein [Gammaproteobacteria bacterium]
MSVHTPMLVVWGHDYIGFQNDAFEELVGEHGFEHLGRPCLRQCAEFSPELATALERGYAGETVHA